MVDNKLLSPEKIHQFSETEQNKTSSQMSDCQGGAGSAFYWLASGGTTNNLGVYGWNNKASSASMFYP